MGTLRRASLGAVSAMAAMSLAACQGSALGGDEDDGSGPIRIGIVAPLSGPAAAAGLDLPEGAELAVEWLKQEGALDDREIELEMVDDQGTPEAAVANVRELTDKGVNIFVGTVNSPVALALAPIMEQTDSVLITTASHAIELTHENASENTFRITDNPYMRQVAQAKLAVEVAPDAKTWSVVGPNHSYGISTIKSFMAGLEQYGDGVTINKPILAPYGAPDYRNSMGKIVGEKPDGVFSSLYGSDAVTAYKQAGDLGLWDDDVVLMDSANEFIVPRAMKEEVPDQWVGMHWYWKAYDNEMSKFIGEEYIAEHDLDPSGFVGEAFAGVLAVAAAVEKADGSTSTDALISALEGLTWDTPTGEREIRAEDHQAIKDVVFIHVTGDDSAREGYTIDDFRVVPGEELIEPATPGEAIDYGLKADF